LKTLLLTLFVLPAGLLASPATEVRVAVADFQSDFHVDQQIGGHGSGRALARILRADLAVLTPLTVVGPWDLKADAADVVRAVTPAEAKAAGESLGATTLVSGQVLAGPAGPIVTARVIYATTGRTQGTLVQSVRGETVADLVSHLAAQVAALAMAQQGLPSGSWQAASILGTRRPGSHSAHDEVACVVDVDGRIVPDETTKWDQPQVLSPGLHEVYVRFYDGQRLMDHDFIFNAVPGAHYRVSFERPADRKATVWIGSADSGEPVTAKAEADTRLPPSQTIDPQNRWPAWLLPLPIPVPGQTH
jgi:hypothetical protein